MENRGNTYPFELLTAYIGFPLNYNSCIPIPFDSGVKGFFVHVGFTPLLC